MKLLTGVAVVVLLSGCALYGADDAVTPPIEEDAGVEADAAPDAAPAPTCDGCALGEWHLSATACDIAVELHVVLATNRGVPFALSLAEPVAAAGVLPGDGSARVYVEDAAGNTWAVELHDDGATATASAAIDVPSGGCEWVGDVTVLERVRL